MKKSLKWYNEIKQELINLGYEYEINWSESLEPVSNSKEFWSEYAWVVISSGLKNQVAREIWNKVFLARARNQGASTVFGHEGKSKAIDHVYENRDRLFAEYQIAENKIEWLQTLPWIGPITKYHLAKNYGFDCVKPDRHLVRIAGDEGPEALCRRLSEQSGDRIATVDVVIWRAANLGLV